MNSKEPDPNVNYMVAERLAAAWRRGYELGPNGNSTAYKAGWDDHAERAKAPEGHIIDDQGRVLRLPGRLLVTADGEPFYETEQGEWVKAKEAAAAVQAERERCLAIIDRDIRITGMQLDNAKQRGRQNTFACVLDALRQIRQRIESGETP
jgi:hypothetical protein